MAALIAATSGYGTVADLTDTTPQPDSADSGAAVEDPATKGSFLWPQFGFLAMGLADSTLGEGSSGASRERWGVVGT